jgi:N-methylhydantoinase A
MTTVLNSFVMPAVSRYLGEIGAGLAARGVTADLHIVRSDAGVMSLAAARERPVNTVLSGPAGGVQAAAHLASAAGFPNIVSIDMGGTSTDVCLSTSAEPRLSTDTWVSHYPIKVPIIDITTIGAGGGSIAFVSSAGALRVGPRSAGADPGPACYGRGGTAPTVTDANLVLGRLPVELAGGEITLDVERAREAIERDIAKPLGISIPEAAYGILRIVNENMLGALRVVSVQRGIDPRELALVPFGGAGPVHGPELARLAGISTVFVPSTPGVLSALGFLLADIKQTFSLTHIGVIGALDERAYNQEIAGLVRQADQWLDREKVTEEDRIVDVALDLRYAGQAYEIPISVSREMKPDDWSDVARRFHAVHQRRYGFDQPFARVEVATLRVTATGRLPRPAFAAQEIAGSDPSGAIAGMAQVYFEGGYQETPVYNRQRLSPGNRLDGPAIITQPDCTTVLAPGQTLDIDRFGNLVIQAT